eukprot:4571196-Amphidinium_carterae.1
MKGAYMSSHECFAQKQSKHSKKIEPTHCQRLLNSYQGVTMHLATVWALVLLAKGLGVKC